MHIFSHQSRYTGGENYNQLRTISIVDIVYAMSKLLFSPIDDVLLHQVGAGHSINRGIELARAQTLVKGTSANSVYQGKRPLYL